MYTFFAHLKNSLEFPSVPTENVRYCFQIREDIELAIINRENIGAFLWKAKDIVTPERILGWRRNWTAVQAEQNIRPGP